MALADLPGRSGGAAPAPDDRLESWKEIAAYLKRDVTTVQRWEKREGLPVHRHVHDKQGSVYAFKTELDAWRARSSTGSGPDGGIRRRRRRRILLASVGVLGGCALAVVLSRASKPRQQQHGVTVAQLTSESGMELFPSLSPDGAWLAYSAGPTGNMDIFLRSVVAGSSPINLTSRSTDRDTQPAFSPDGTTIAFRSDRDGGGIFLMDVTGQSLRRVADFGFNPAWSPDGQRLVIATVSIDIAPDFRPELSQLWIIDVRTGERRRLALNDGVQPAWSPDGQRIAYWAVPAVGTRRDIWTVRPEGGRPIQLTDDTAVDWSPTWSADGRYVYFVSNRDGSMNLWRVGVDERIGQRVGSPESFTVPSMSVAHPSFSRDGRRLVWTSIVASQNLQMVAIDPRALKTIAPEMPITSRLSGWGAIVASPDGAWIVVERENTLRVSHLDAKDERLVSPSHLRAKVPVWSHDSTRIAFQAEVDGKAEIWTVARDGSDLGRAVSRSGDSGTPVWAPDNARLAYADFSTEPPGVRVVSLRTGADEALPPFDSIRSFRPTSWSDDGRRLAGFVRSKGGVVVYTMDEGKYDELTSGGGGMSDWFPGGRRLVFESDDHPGKLLIIDRITRKVQALGSWNADRNFVGQPHITHDGRRVFFKRLYLESDLWIRTH